MTAQTIAETYFDAWNRHDAAGIIGSFAEGGIYQDPTTGGPLTGQAIGAYAAGLWSAFPNLSFEIRSRASAGDSLVSAEWMMRGTNHGSIFGLPPTGKIIELPGADFVRVSEEGIHSVAGYFDTRSFVEQLGLQAIVQPSRAGPFTFGTAIAVRTGKRTRPGAISMTSLYPTSSEQVEYVRNTSQQIVQEMLQMPGFIAWNGLNLNEIMMTVTAWESPEDVRAFMQNPTHRAAVREYYSSLGIESSMVSTWVPQHISTTVRCTTCGKISGYERTEGQCPCGARLPEPLPYW
jgi:steroid delta-isomerase-like uncharacterized protein